MQTILNNVAAARFDVTIANGAAVTGNIYDATGATASEARIYGFRGLGVYTIGDWTAADLTVDTSMDGSTWETVRNETGAIIRATNLQSPSGGFAQIFPASVWLAGAMPYVRLRSVNTASEANVNQGAARTLTVVLLR